MTSRAIGNPGPLASVATLLRSSTRLMREQWLGPDELADRRLARLRLLLERAADAPYYRDAIHRAGISDPSRVEMEDLSKLPLLDRGTIERHGMDAFLTAGSAGLVSVVTSGSTGMPARFLRSRLEEADYSARWWRVYAAYGCHMLDAQINLATPNKSERAGPIALLRRTGILPRIERLASGAPPADLLNRLQAVKPPILTGYSGALEGLAEHVLATGAQIRAPRAVFCTAMEVTDRCLELTEAAFRAPAVDVYVTNEFGVIAWSCPVRRDLLHLNDDSFVLEVLDADGDPCPIGERGELVITALALTAMPLIRYRMGDIAACIPGPCECGRGLGLMSRVQGRTSHVIRRPGGALITTPLITSIFARAEAYDWVRRFQVREEAADLLRFLLDVRRAPTEAQRQRLQSEIESAVGRGLAVRLELVDEIPLAPNGKLQFLVPFSRAPREGALV